MQKKGFKVILITGARQVGKTTFLNSISKNMNYVTLDNPKNLLLAKTDPEMFFQRFSLPVFIDEVQYAPELFPYIKMLVDSSNKTGQVFITGSQQYSMMRNITESLAGRVAIIDMLGFSIYERENKGLLQKPFLPSTKSKEILKHNSVADTYKVIWRGSYPQMINKPSLNWELFYSSYLKSYLERDIKQLTNIISEDNFVRFMCIVAARTGQELNIAEISKTSGTTVKTVNEWLSVLEASGIIFLLKPYYKNITKRFVKRPRIYFTDTGLCSYLTEWITPETLEKGAMSGAIFETFVINEIIKSYKHNGKSQAFYYYRDSNRNEIDLLISRNGLFYPIEIKKTANPSKEDIKAFDTLSQFEKIEYGSLICLTNKIYPLTKTTNAISIWNI
ncbi:MAG: ATP-binding protein [Clostridiales Family XIII bacterium]|nr:ATP-binding protein [Clostridiales Family XIII bacterium]